MTASTTPSDSALGIEVARRYYIADESKSQIGQALGISRFKVARLLQQARENGTVRIDIASPDDRADDLAERVRAAYGLRRCVVVSSPDGHAREAVGRAGAALLGEVVGPDDVLGLPWARTVTLLVEALPRLPSVPVVQLSGSLVPGVTSPVDVVRRAAGLAGAKAHLYYAPLILDTAASARALRRQPDVADAREQVSRVTVAVVSVGAWASGQSTVYDVLPDRDRRSLARDGVVGEVIGIFFGRDGRVLTPKMSDRMVTISGQELAAIPDVVALSTGAAKVEATCALLRGGLAASLVSDVALAEGLLALA